MHTLLLLLPLLIGCESEAPKESKTAKNAKPACDVSLKTMAGTDWLRVNPDDGKPQVQSRARFYEEGGKLKAKYTAGSIGDVYTYTCTEKSGILDCLEDEAHAEAWCKAWASVHDGVCDPEKIAPILGMTVDELKPIAEKVNKELKGLKPAEREQQRKVDNSPGNKLRAHFLVAVDTPTCQITLQDKFMTMFNGQPQEYENVNGSSNFARTKEEYIWEGCKESSAYTVDEAGKDVKGPFPVGTIKVQGGLPSGQKADAACTYTADVYADWAKATSDLAANVDPKNGPTFATAVPFTSTGLHTVFFDRYKTCADKKERIGLSCVAFRVQ